MQNSITWVGMDVHAENIVLAALRDSSDAVLFRAEFPNTPKGRERLAGRLAENVPVRCVYEAGPCGYELRRFLEEKSIDCQVAAPALIPRKPGDRVKTDRKELMAFIGVVPRERSSGGRERRGSITKTGNAHIRRVLIESAWHYQHPRGNTQNYSRPARRTTTRGDRNRQKGRTAPPQEVHETARKRKTEGGRGRRRGEGTGRIHLGAWARIIA